MPQFEKIQRTRSGCTSCKRRRVKCDETTPDCLQCIKRGLDCPGYARAFKWSDKYAKLQYPPRSASYDTNVEAEQQGSQYRCSTDDADRSDLSGLVDITLNPISAFDCDKIRLDTPNHDTVHSPEIELEDRTSPSNSTDLIALRPAHGSISPQPRHTDKLTVIASALHTEADLLSMHYFSSVCIINSGFDSPANPFRTYVAELMSTDATIYHCMLSMSAAHLYQHNVVFKNVGLKYRTEAISSLRATLSHTSGQGIPEIASQSWLSTLLFGTLLLGMSSPWHEVSSLGQTFLHGARSLLKMSLVEYTTSSTVSRALHTCTLAFRDRAEANFLIGAVAFWETLSSFHIDQDISAVDYLSPLCLSMEAEDIAPNPWTGANTGLFILAAKVGIITRQARLLRRLGNTLPTVRGGPDLLKDLLETATDLESRVRRYMIRPARWTRDTDDKCTPATHFETMAQVYQLTMRLELYQVFPGLLMQDDEGHHYYGITSRPPLSSQTGHIEIIRALAVHILTLLCSIPVTSGTKAIQLLPLVIAGSALQYHQPTGLDAQTTGKQYITQEVISLSSNETVILHWRSMVRNTLSTIYRYVGLESAQRGAKIVEGVWRRSDARYRCSCSRNEIETADFVHWADVMSEEHSETLLG